MSANFQATAGELGLVSRILAQGDPSKTGLLSGDVAVRIFGGANLPPTALGEIWAIADEDNRGSLSSKGVAIAVRLIGWAQKGEKVSPALVSKPGPLPHIDGVSDLAVHNTGMSIPRSPPPPSAGLPPLTAQDRAKFQAMFAKNNPVNGLLTGDQARNIFVKSKLPNDKLGQIWMLADTRERGSLDTADFTIAMYFIQGVMSGQISTLPQSLPPDIYRQATGMGGPTASVISHNTGNSGSYSPVASTFSQNRLTPQYTGQSQMLQPNLTGSMSSRRPPAPPHLPTRPDASRIGSGAFGHAPPLPWDISAAEKTESDGFFETLDTNHLGYIEGDVAVPFMLESQLPGEDLALVWDLADMNNDGRLTKEGFAVAMHLIKKKLAGGIIPATLPQSLIPPSMRRPTSMASPFASAPAPAPAPAPSAQDSLADLIWDDPPPAAPPLAPQPTGMSVSASAFSSPAPAPPSVPTRSVASPPLPPRMGSQAQDPFGASPFGNTNTAAQDLMGDEEATPASPPLQDRSAEIGNTQNQLNSTNRSLQSAKEEREAAEQALASQASQLVNLQTQLSSAKAAYETESKLLATLRDRMNAQTADMQKVRESIISAESDLSAVRVEKAEIEGTVLRDKEEIRELNRKMAEFSKESEVLKAETDKVKKDAKQQRGLLAIARKQLATKEAEKDKARKELEEAQTDLDTVTKEADDVEGAIAKLDSEPAAAPALPERALSSDSLAFAAAQPIPGTPDLSTSSPAGSVKSNNPFGRLAKSGSSTPTRTGSPFLPFAGTSVPSPSTNNDSQTDPFGFAQAFETEPEDVPKPVEEATLEHKPEPEVFEQPTGVPLADATSPTSQDGTEEFKTPPMSTTTLPDVTTPPARSDTVDSTTDKFPDLEDLKPEPTMSRHLPGHYPQPSEAFNLDAPVKELEVDDSDSSDEEDETPLAMLKTNGHAAPSASSEPAAPAPVSSTFDDIFGVGEAAPTAPSSLAAEPAPDASSSPFQVSPFGSSDAFGAPSSASAPVPAVEQKPAGVNAFDEAMGIIAPSAAPSQSTTAPSAFSFDDAFDDSFDFGGSPAPAPDPTPAAPVASSPFPQPQPQSPKSNGALPSNGTPIFPTPATSRPSAPASPVAPTPAPAAAAPGPSFDDVFSGFDSSSPPDLGASLQSPTTSAAPPAKAPEASTQSFPASPPKSINSNMTSRPVSPPPRVSSPTARPRPSTSSSIEKKEPAARHSKLSIRLPFGKKKKQAQEPPPPQPSQFLTPPAEEPRVGTPAADDDVESVKQIIAMGFSRSQAVEALEKHGYDVNRALNSLLGAS